MKHARASCSMLCLCVLTACAVGPDFESIFTVAEEQTLFVNAPEEALEEGASMNRWWERIDDPLLNEYVEILLKDNLSLKEAGERVLQAQAIVAVQRGGYFPTLGVDTSAQRSFQPVNGFAFPGGGGNERFYNTLYNANLTTSWQLDLFGRVRRSVESARANFEASQFDKQALEQSLIADLLTRRVAIAVNRNLLELARSNAANQQAIYDLVKRRYELGASTTAADVYLAEESFRTVQADIANYERLVAEESYKLDVLLGKAPGTSSPDTEFPLLPPPREAALCVPAALLDRRPDLRASELRAVAANADIGVAIADLYPNISITGSIGVAGDATSNLFSYDQLAGSLLGSITNRLFEGGSLRANIRLQEAEAREIAANYAGTVLEALREVETALNAETNIAKELEQKERSVNALLKAEEITERRYRQGIQTLREYLETQQRRYLIEQDFLLTQQQKWQARINLYLALGGDWLKDEDEENDEKDNETAAAKQPASPCRLTNEAAS